MSVIGPSCYSELQQHVTANPHGQQLRSGDIRPLRLGIQHKPPALVIEYTSNSSDGEDERLLHRIWVDDRVTRHKIKELASALQKHPIHGTYVRNVRKPQLLELLRRIQDVLGHSESATTQAPACQHQHAARGTASSRERSQRKHQVPAVQQGGSMKLAGEAEPRIVDEALESKRAVTCSRLQQGSGSSETSAVRPSDASQIDVKHHSIKGEDKPLIRNEAEESKGMPRKRKGSPERSAAASHIEAVSVRRQSGKGASHVPEVIAGKLPHSEPDGETWAAFVSRAREELSSFGDNGVADEPLDLFEHFRSTTDLSETFATFACLFHLASTPQKLGGRRRDSLLTVAPPWDTDAPGRHWRYPYESIRSLTGGNWKAKRLWESFDSRCGRKVYAEGMPCGKGSRMADKHVVVIGAGPCGLRAAIELRLLGARVTVVDKREKFTRINQLHLWDWLGEELKQLGARTLEPPPLDFASDPDKLHICICDLQTLLVKVALLLGVEIFLGTEYRGCEWIDSGWVVKLAHAGETPPSPTKPSRGAAVTLPLPPSEIPHVITLVGATGMGCTIGRDVGMETLISNNLKAESAIGLVCNFTRTHGKGEGRLRSFSMARQFYAQLFAEVAQQTGAELENIVYVKGHLSHYFVMTPTRRSLIKSGVAVDAGAAVLSKGNIDTHKLDALVQKLIAFPFKKSQPTLKEALMQDRPEQEPAYADNGPMLFDFSIMSRSQEGLTFVPPPGPGEGVDEVDFLEQDNLLVALVGDALIEPFWPEGLGIARGFFGVWDTCSAIAEWGSGGTQEHVFEHFQEAFAQLKTLSAATRTQVLRESKDHGYSLAPNTRYRIFDPARRITLRDPSQKRSRSTPAVHRIVSPSRSRP